MDTNTMLLISEYEYHYFPVKSYDILETVLHNFCNQLVYTDPSYQQEAVEELRRRLVTDLV